MRVHDKVDIGGAWQAPADGSLVDVVDPSTEEVVARVARITRPDVDAALGAARASLDSAVWSSRPIGERAAVVRRFADLLEARMPELAPQLSQEMGQPLLIAQMLHANAAPLVRDLADLAEARPQEEVRHGMRGPAFVRRGPVGVVVAIVPYNGPLFVSLVKLVPALLAGCSVVLKPPPEAPSACLAMADLLRDAGVPRGVVSILPGDGLVGEALVQHPEVDMVSFTGSTAAGRAIGTHCGGALKRMTLELGGKSAAIVLDDADLDVLVPSMVMGAFGNAGQVCVALTRLLVPRQRHDEVVDALREVTAGLPIGPAVEPTTMIGPLISARQRDKVERYVELGQDEGAKVAVGGRRPPHLDRGFFYEPTILTGVANDHRVAREEIFGPVLSVIPYEGGDDVAVELANDSPFGLHGAVFTADRERGLQVADRVRAGTFTVNGYVLNEAAPFGGVKASGVGREFGPEGLDEYVELRTINVPLDAAPDADG